MFFIPKAEQVGFLSFTASMQRFELLLTTTEYRVCGLDSRNVHIK